VVRQIESEVVHLVGDGQVHDAVLLDPKRLATHRAADERTTLDTLSKEMLRFLKAILGVGAEGEARDEAALAGLRPELWRSLTIKLTVASTDRGDFRQPPPLDKADVGVEFSRSYVEASEVETVELAEVIDLDSFFQA
jgi:hypothetical protein